MAIGVILSMAILLMTIGVILLVAILLMTIGVILSMDIGGYFINGYW